jgi:sialate O-acetylesterase
MKNQFQDRDVWVMAGQSNMEGVGELSQALPPDERVWCHSSAGKWEIARDPLHRLWESFTPVDQALMRPGVPKEKQAWSDAELAAEQARTREWGGGLGIAFGKMMAEASGRPVGLIAAAHGATSLEDWNASRKSQGGHSLYGAMLERIARAGGVLRGVLWYQGESDAWNAAAGASYGERFAQWVAALRADLGRPDLPVLTVQLGCTTLDSPNVGAWNTIRHQQYELPDRVPFVTVTSAVDLGLTDPIHVNARGLHRLGRRLARQALALAAGSRQGLGPRVKRVESVPSSTQQGTVRLVCEGVSGEWSPVDHMAGFMHLSAGGEPVPGNPVYNAFADPRDRTAILLRLNLPMQPGESIAYGQGLRPYCNVVDGADMPLCAFNLPPASGAVG